jgi:formate hydrogenlyase subunit 3/multisubunit Na+/H+ antiporter MnhD subunit
MSAPMIWIGLPIALAGLLFLLRNLRFPVFISGLLLSSWLWIAAWLLPIGEVITLGGRSFRILESFSIFGRDFILLDSDRGLLVLVYFALMIWILGSWFAKPGSAFIPLSFVLSAILVGALAVEPFLYAALLIEISVLIAVPLLSPPHQTPGRGVFRFLAFQTLGMPFILLAGWFLTGLEASPGQTGLVLRAGLMIGIGLSFLLALVPFHSWVPQVAEESHPYVAAFLLFLLPSMISIFGLGFLDRFIWLRESESVYLGLRVVGALMLLMGGAWGAVEKHLGRFLGHITIAETGIGLLAVGIGSADGVLLFFWLMVARLVSFVPLATGISMIWEKNDGKIRLNELWGRGHQMPLIAGLVIITQFSLVGAPLLVGFSARLALWRVLAGVAPLIAAAGLLGNIGLLVGAVRSVNALFVPISNEGLLRGEPSGGLFAREGVLVSERLLEWLVYLVLILGINIFSWFPQFYLPWIENLLLIFERIGG